MGPSEPLLLLLFLKGLQFKSSVDQDGMFWGDVSWTPTRGCLFPCFKVRTSDSRSEEVTVRVGLGQIRHLKGQEWFLLLSLRPAFRQTLICVFLSRLWWMPQSGEEFFFNILIFIYLFFEFKFILIRGQLLYNIVLVLPYIIMNPPRLYTCSQSWTPLPPPSPYHPSMKVW